MSCLLRKTILFLLMAALLLSGCGQTQEPTVPETEPPETTVPETLPPETEPEKVTVDKVPLYYQSDYPYIKFGSGTIATSGCSVTCLAMIATYMTDHEYTPPQMAYHFGRYGKTHIQRLDYGISQLQLPCQRTEDIRDVFAGLRSGKVAILLMDEESVFTTEQHFIVVAGMTEDGKFLVNDPMEAHYLKASDRVKQGFETGFADYYLSNGFSGGWIFDKSEMPEEPFLYDASLPEQKENRYEGYMLTGEDIYIIACFVWAEARNEPPIVQQAVAEVVLNRVMCDKYPNTVKDIMRKTEFYRSLDDITRLDEPELDQYIAVDAAMYGPYILPEDVCFYATWDTGDNLWGTLGSYSFFHQK